MGETAIVGPSDRDFLDHEGREGHKSLFKHRLT
jgi:hypothetical protein